MHAFGRISKHFVEQARGYVHVLEVLHHKLTGRFETVVGIFVGYVSGIYGVRAVDTESWGLRTLPPFSTPSEREDAGADAVTSTEKRSCAILSDDSSQIKGGAYVSPQAVEMDSQILGFVSD